MLGEAIEALPETWAQGHRRGDHVDDAAKELIVRTDAGGTTQWLIEECRDRNIEFCCGTSITARIREAICCLDDTDWVAATDTNNRSYHHGAQIAEITQFLDLSGWDGYDHEPSARVIVRRERPHPGAQLTLFDTIEGHRHTAIITSLTDDDIAGLEEQYRMRARAENTIADAKACGLAKLPFDNIVANTLWARLTAVANNLLRWTCALGFTGAVAKARPKTIRNRILHVAGHSTTAGRRLRLDQTWRWTRHILHALHPSRPPSRGHRQLDLADLSRPSLRSRPTTTVARPPARGCVTFIAKMISHLDLQPGLEHLPHQTRQQPLIARELNALAARPLNQHLSPLPSAAPSGETLAGHSRQLRTLRSRPIHRLPDRPRQDQLR